jgi:hypothetical protein
MHLVGVPDAVLLLQQVRARVEEGRWGSHGGEHSDRLAELVVQAMEGVDDEGGVGDGGAAVIECVGETFLQYSPMDISP